jgi:uncharacterized protein (DUF433 family)
MATDVLSRYISSDPKIFGGKPHITGHRIRVVDVAVWNEKFGWSPDTIASKFNLSLAEVHAALAYYFANREALAAELKADAAFVEELKQRYPARLTGKAGG